jgi:hypothetical protein
MTTNKTKFILIVGAYVLLLLASIIYNANAQTFVKLDSKGNYTAIAKTSVKGQSKAIATGKTYTDAKGKIYPVMKSDKGKLFIIRTSAKGSTYKQYLKIN